MFRLITKRGIIQNHLKETDSLVDFSIKGFDIECRWRHKYQDLEEGDDIVIVGYLGDDEYGDPILYGCAYFNISKNKRSDGKQKSLYALISAIVATLLMITYGKMIVNDYLLTLLIFLLAALIFFSSVHALIAYQILEKEIKNLVHR